MNVEVLAVDSAADPLTDLENRSEHLLSSKIRWPSARVGRRSRLLPEELVWVEALMPPHAALQPDAFATI